MTTTPNDESAYTVGSLQRNSSGWSEADLQRLKDLLGSGASAVRVAAALNRTSAAVKRQARKFGSAFLGMQEAKRRRQAKIVAAQSEIAMTRGRADKMIE
jgi:GcrA cell cycle regulator